MLSVSDLPERFALQLNDTHPSIGVAELMRLLVDERDIDWDEAWDITVATFGYTNHTLLPEALETWPLAMFAESLPRHLEIIYEINRRFLDEVRAKFPGDEDRLRRMSLIGEDGGKSVRMAHLATVGSHAINGVAALHSELLKESVLKDFFELWPERFSNKTNGVTPRRFLALANPRSARAARRHDRRRLAVGPGQAARARGVRRRRRVPRPVARGQAGEQGAPGRVRAGRRPASSSIPTGCSTSRSSASTSTSVSTSTCCTSSRCTTGCKQNPSLEIPPRAFIFGGKAAPGYFLAKRIIKLINAVGETVNNDPDVNRFLKVAFVPNFNVQNAHLIYPAADLSEQISTAGKEASGTGNMKFMLNGALTIGTLDGANVEMREEVGAENFFLFGLTDDEVERIKRDGYRPSDYVDGNGELAAVLDLIAGGTFSHGDTEVFRPLVDNLRYDDPFLVLADYASYVECQDRVSAAWQDTRRWTRMSILNTARSGKFSSDRAIAEYCDDIWNVLPVTVKV